MSLNVAQDARKPSRPHFTGKGGKQSLAIRPVGEKSLLIPNPAAVLTVGVQAEDGS